VTSSAVILCGVFRETVLLLLPIPVKSYVVHVNRCVRPPGRGFTALHVALFTDANLLPADIASFPATSEQ